MKYPISPKQGEGIELVMVVMQDDTLPVLCVDLVDHAFVARRWLLRQGYGTHTTAPENQALLFAVGWRDVAACLQSKETPIKSVRPELVEGHVQLIKSVRPEPVEGHVQLTKSVRPEPVEEQIVHRRLCMSLIHGSTGSPRSRA